MKQESSITYTEWLKQFKDVCINAGLKIEKIHDEEHTPFVDAWLNRRSPRNQADIFIKKIREDEKKKKEERRSGQSIFSREYK